MNVELITCPDSPQCKSAKMYLDMLGVEYKTTELSHEEMQSQGFDEMPILMIDDEVAMLGLQVAALSKLFGK